MISVNYVGDSSPSAKLRIIAASVPAAPLSITLISQAKTFVSFSWIAGDDGGTPIRDYEVFGDQGDSNLAVDSFIQLADSTFLTQQHTEGDLTPGTVYRFIVKARNDAGLGA